MSDALVDRLRDLPAPLALAAIEQLEAELGPEAVGVLETDWDFWKRSKQRFPGPRERPAVVIYVGEYAAGKTRTAWELLHHLVVTGRAQIARILAATGAAARSIVAKPKVGMLAWARPGVTYHYQPSNGFEGQLAINGTIVDLMSIDAPRTALGEAGDVQLLDDPPKWGPTGRAALVAALKSAREKGCLTIIPTTEDGLVLVGDVLGVDLRGPGRDEAARLAGVLVIDLGESEENAGNLDENYFRMKANLQRAGLWDPIGGGSPWAAFTSEQWRAMRLEHCPPLVELCISIDPTKSASKVSCEVGILGGGRDARSVIHTRYDRSAVLDAGVNGWPKVAWDLAVDLQREHPGTPWHFLFESNVGKDRAELLNGEERARRRRGEPVPLPHGGWADAANRAEVNVCEVRFVKADKDKCKRAESPARLAAQLQVRHAPRLETLEGQQRNLTPTSTDSDRADAENHMITDLAGLGDTKAADVARARERSRAATAEAFSKLEEMNQRSSRVDFDLDRA